MPTPDEKDKMVQETLLRMTKSLRLGREKTEVFKTQMGMAKNKIELYVLQAQGKISDEEAMKLRNEISSTLEVALDAIDFIRHMRKDDEVFFNETVGKLEL